MTIIEKILNHDELLKQPPVVLDIGASGEIHKEWETFAKYAICIAFDADDREMGFVENVEAGYKKLVVYNRIVTDSKDRKMDFYLTKSPYCSSLLPPDNESLENWSFGELFEVDRMVNLETVEMVTVLKELKVDKIDWFKTDSQGTDLRLFKSLGEDIIDKMIVADFEPGILDAYKGEDKAFKIIEYMDTRSFWLCDIEVKGPERVNFNELKEEFSADELQYFAYGSSVLRNTPGWAEMSFFNSFDNNENLSMRDYLLGFLFSYIKEQYGHCLHIAKEGTKLFDEPLFTQLKEHTVALLKDKIKASSKARGGSGLKRAVKRLVGRK